MGLTTDAKDAGMKDRQDTTPTPTSRVVPDHAPRSVSVENQFPEDLFDAMVAFVGSHPQWDQYRLMQAALAGFLFQHGCQDRAVARHYLTGLFQWGGASLPGPRS